MSEKPHASVESAIQAAVREALVETFREVVLPQLDIIAAELKAATEQLSAYRSEVAPEYLSVQDAADVASVCEATIRKWVSNGSLDEHRAGRVIRVRRDELIDLLRRDSRERESSVDGKVHELISRRARR